MLTSSVKHEKLKSFRNLGADDRSTPRLRHGEKVRQNLAEPYKPEEIPAVSPKVARENTRVESWRKYCQADHAPKAVFNPAHRLELNPEYEQTGRNI